jgi:hypothetical protein
MTTNINPKHEILNVMVIRASGYQVVPACGRQGYQSAKKSHCKMING